MLCNTPGSELFVCFCCSVQLFCMKQEEGVCVFTGSAVRSMGALGFLASLQACERGGGCTVGWMRSRYMQLLVVLNNFLLQEHISQLKKKKGALGF